MNGRAAVGLGLLVFVLALAVRLAHVAEYRSEVGLDVSRIAQSDNHVFAEWARQIAAGDVLCRNQPHAWHFWTRQVAPDAQWVDWYGGERTYHQAPLYPYFLAAVFRSFGDDRTAVAIVQAVLGALTCLLTFVLGRRVAGPRVGVVAGLLLALCSPYFFYDVFLLRDGPIALLVVVAALAAERVLRLGRRRDWLGLGAALGLFTLMKETGPALLVLAIGLAAWRHRAALRRAALPAGLLVLGFLVVAAPAYARNVAVGAPTFRLSTRGPEVFIAGNAAGQDGRSWDPPIDLTRRILTETGFSLPGAMIESIETHRSAPTGYLALLWEKTRAFFSGEEIPNNVNYDQFRAHLSTLRIGFVTVTFLGPACLLGLFLGLRRRERLAAPYLLFLALSASVIALYVLGRFRIQVLPLMALFSAVAIDDVARRLRRAPMAALPPLLAFGALLWVAWPKPSVFTAENKHAAFMMMHVVTDDLERARRFRDAHRAAIGDLDLEAIDPDQRRFLAALDAAFERYEEAHEHRGAERMLRLGRAYADYVEATGGFLQGLMRERAFECLDEARRLDRGLAGPDYETGRVLMASHDLDGAVLSFVRELGFAPEHPGAHRGIGLIMYGLERRDASVRHLEMAIRGGEDDAALLATSALVRGSPSMIDKSVPLVGGEMLRVYAPELAIERARAARAAAGPSEVEVLLRVGLALYAAGRGLEDREALLEGRAVFEGLIEAQPGRAAEWERLASVIDDTLAALHLSPR